MSQTPIIQALKWLEFQQLVRHEPHRGYYTAPISLQEVEEIYDLRLLIEMNLLPVTLERLWETSLCAPAFQPDSKSHEDAKDEEKPLVLRALDGQVQSGRLAAQKLGELLVHDLNDLLRRA